MFCKWCGEKIKENKSTCSSCGKMQDSLENGNGFWDLCETKMSNVEESNVMSNNPSGSYYESDKSESKGTRIWIIISIVLSVLVLIATVFGIIISANTVSKIHEIESGLSSVSSQVNDLKKHSSQDNHSELVQEPSESVDDTEPSTDESTSEYEPITDESLGDVEHQNSIANHYDSSFICVDINDINLRHNKVIVDVAVNNKNNKKIISIDFSLSKIRTIDEDRIESYFLDSELFDDIEPGNTGNAKIYYSFKGKKNAELVCEIDSVIVKYDDESIECITFN